MKKIVVAAFLLVTVALAQRTIFTQPVGDDTLRIKADACLWTRWWLTSTDSGETKSLSSTFGQANGFLGATVQYGKYVYARYYYDLGAIDGKPAYDLIAGVTAWNLDFRFGQLKLPLGYEVICAPWKADFVDGTLLAKNRTATGSTRDIGALLSYGHPYFQAAIGVVNGNGRNVACDNNSLLDAALRLAGCPLGNPSLLLGGNLYYGNDIFSRKDDRRPFIRIGAEGSWIQPTYFARGEFLWGKDTLGKDTIIGELLVPTRRVAQGYTIAAGARFGRWQPVARYESFGFNGEGTTTITAGVNAFFVHDMLKPMLNVSYIDDKVKRTRTIKPAFLLQAAFW